MSDTVMQSFECYELTRNKRRRGFVYEDEDKTTVFVAPDDMGDTISIRAVAPWIPMHPKEANR